MMHCYYNGNTNSLNSISILVFVICGTLSRKMSLHYNQCAKISSWLKKSRSCTMNGSWPAAESFFTTFSWPPKTQKSVLSLPAATRSPTLFRDSGLVISVSLSSNFSSLQKRCLARYAHAEAALWWFRSCCSRAERDRWTRLRSRILC